MNYRIWVFAYNDWGGLCGRRAFYVGFVEATGIFGFDLVCFFSAGSAQGVGTETVG